MLNKGFTLIESLLTILVMTLFLHLSIFSLHFLNFSQNEIELVSEDLAIKQFNSIYYKKSFCFDKDNLIAQYPICFNSAGNVNMAQTTKFLSNSKELVIHLGAGKHEIK